MGDRPGILGYLQYPHQRAIDAGPTDAKRDALR
jgi:hypothetical protein